MMRFSTQPIGINGIGKQHILPSLMDLKFLKISSSAPPYLNCIKVKTLKNAISEKMYCSSKIKTDLSKMELSSILYSSKESENLDQWVPCPELSKCVVSTEDKYHLGEKRDTHNYLDEKICNNAFTSSITKYNRNLNNIEGSSEPTNLHFHNEEILKNNQQACPIISQESNKSAQISTQLDKIRNINHIPADRDSITFFPTNNVDINGLRQGIRNRPSASCKEKVYESSIDSVADIIKTSQDLFDQEHLSTKSNIFPKSERLSEIKYNPLQMESILSHSSGNYFPEGNHEVNECNEQSLKQYYHCQSNEYYVIEETCECPQENNECIQKSDEIIMNKNEQGISYAKEEILQIRGENLVYNTLQENFKIVEPLLTLSDDSPINSNLNVITFSPLTDLEDDNSVFENHIDVTLPLPMPHKDIVACTSQENSIETINENPNSQINNIIVDEVQINNFPVHSFSIIDTSSLDKFKNKTKPESSDMHENACLNFKYDCHELHKKNESIRDDDTNQISDFNCSPHENLYLNSVNGKNQIQEKLKRKIEIIESLEYPVNQPHASDNFKLSDDVENTSMFTVKHTIAKINGIKCPNILHSHNFANDLSTDIVPEFSGTEYSHSLSYESYKDEKSSSFSPLPKKKREKNIVKSTTENTCQIKPEQFTNYTKGSASKSSDNIPQSTEACVPQEQIASNSCKTAPDINDCINCNELASEQIVPNYRSVLCKCKSNSDDELPNKGVYSGNIFELNLKTEIFIVPKVEFLSLNSCFDKCNDNDDLR